MRPEWASVQMLKDRFKRNLHPTLRRYVGHGPKCPMAMLVSTPLWKEKPGAEEHRWRHFVVSDQFAERFVNVDAARLLHAVDTYAEQCFGGPAAEFTLPLTDDNGQTHEFQAESFNNTYDLLTLFVWRCKLSTARIAVPQGVSLI